MGQQGETAKSRIANAHGAAHQQGQEVCYLALGGRAWRWWWDRRDLILGKLELGPPSAARVGEHDIPSGAVKPIPVLLQVKSSLEQARNGSKVVPDGDDGVETAWWWRCESLGRPCRR